jgi:hypothetical protein
MAKADHLYALAAMSAKYCEWRFGWSRPSGLRFGTAKHFGFSRLGKLPRGLFLS